MIDDHITQWFGLPVEEYNPEADRGSLDYANKIYSLGYTYDNESFDAAVLAAFLDDPRAKALKAIVIGMPGEHGSSFDDVIAAIADRGHLLESLRGVFLGDIIQEENEISWIEQSNVQPLLEALPRLEELRIRGGSGLEFPPTAHGGLKKLVIETGGMPQEVIRNIALSSFPNLTHLELWLGTDEYGWTGSPEDVPALLDSELFPRLEYLGLRNSEIANEIAAMVADSPILEQLTTLDLSGGTLTDEGAAHLLTSARVARLKNLNLYRNYLTQPTIARLHALGPKVDTGGQEKPDDWDGEAHYYVAVGE